jgi:hypothetical protein
MTVADPLYRRFIFAKTEVIGTVQAPRGSRRCIFCGTARDLTREHAVPRWVSKDVFLDMPIFAYHGSDRDHAVRPYMSKGVTAAPRIVCRECNNGWLNRLEIKARNGIGPIMSGHKKRLSAEEQAVAALWALKTSIVLEFDRPVDPIIPTWHAHYIYENETLPPGSRVWLAYQRGVEELGVHFFPFPYGLSVRGRESYDVPGYVLTLTVARVVFQIYGSASQEYAVIHDTYFDSDDGYASSIWPPTGTVDWPAEKGLTYEDLNRFATRLEPKMSDRYLVDISGEVVDAIPLDGPAPDEVVPDSSS